MAFRKAERKQTKLKIGISAPSGAGKTYSALLIAHGISGDWDKVAVLDTENGSAEMYSSLGEYSVCPIEPPFTVDKYVKGIQEAVAEGFSVLIIDSLSHAWNGDGGLLEKHDKATKASRSGNSFTSWRDITPEYQRLIDAILQAPIDVIVTTRAKSDYIETDNNGKKGYKKVGLAPIFREGLDYELTVFFELSQDHIATTTKDRTELFDGQNFIPDKSTGEKLNAWRNGGVISAQKPERAPAQTHEQDEPKTAQKPDFKASKGAKVQKLTLSELTSYGCKEAARTAAWICKQYGVNELSELSDEETEAAREFVKERAKKERQKALEQADGDLPFPAEENK